jgi:valyl-tRNA synthetase
MKIGRRLAIKLLNASKFTLGVAGKDVTLDVTAVHAPLDQALLTGLGSLIDDVTTAFEGYDYARALEHTERFFWRFCDDYVELVKQRAYGAGDEAGADSARATLVLVLDHLLRLFAPHLPFVTEEVWSWWRPGSVHRAAWPERSTLGPAAAGGAPEVFDLAAEVLGAVRKAKTAQQRSLRSAVELVVVRDTPARLALLATVQDDVREAARARELKLLEGEPAGIDVVLTPPDPT